MTTTSTYDPFSFRLTRQHAVGYRSGTPVSAVAAKGSYDVGGQRVRFDNHLRSACIETNAAGEVISYEEFHPYGITAYHAGLGVLDANPKRYRYSGKERDTESGLYYYGARYLAPWLGRWVSPDPAGFVDGVNVYGFVRGRPSTGCDEEGRQEFEFDTIESSGEYDATEGLCKPEVDPPLPDDIQHHDPIEIVGTRPPTISPSGEGFERVIYEIDPLTGRAEPVDVTYDPVDPRPIILKPGGRISNASDETIEEINAPGSGELSIISFGLTRFNSDLRDFGGNFPPDYRIVLGTALLEHAAHSEDPDGAMAQMINSIGTNGTPGAHSLFHVYDAVTGQGFDKLQHFVSSGALQFGSPLNLRIFTDARQTFKERKDALNGLFNDWDRWDPEDVRVNEAGQDLGVRLNSEVHPLRSDPTRLGEYFDPLGGLSRMVRYHLIERWMDQ